MNLPPIHRVVTGHNKEGQAIITSSGTLAKVVDIEAIPGTTFHEVWCTEDSPTSIDAQIKDPTIAELMLPPPKNGTRIRFVDIPPDTEDFLNNGADKMASSFDTMGGEHLSTVKDNSPHPLMHRTETVDYGIVIQGEITIILDDSEETVPCGGVIIQQGTNHAWANRTNEMCRMLFVLVDGQYTEKLATNLSC